MIWWCGYEEKLLPWSEDIWPTYCPLCGSGVNRQLSTHHELTQAGEAPRIVEDWRGES